MARKKKEELKGALENNVAVEEKATATQQTEKAAEVKTKKKKTSAKKDSKKFEEVEIKSEAEQEAQDDFEDNSVSTFTDLNLCFESDPLDEEVDDDLSIDWKEILSISLTGVTISVCKEIGQPLYVVVASYPRDFIVLQPITQEYPGYIANGYFRSRLDAESFYDFCVLDYLSNKNKFKNVRDF